MARLGHVENDNLKPHTQTETKQEKPNENGQPEKTPDLFDKFAAFVQDKVKGMQDNPALDAAVKAAANAKNAKVEITFELKENKDAEGEALNEDLLMLFRFSLNGVPLLAPNPEIVK